MSEAKNTLITTDWAEEVLNNASNLARRHEMNSAGEFIFSIASEPTLSELQAMLFLALEKTPKTSPLYVRAAKCTVNPDHLDSNSEYGITFAGAQHLIELYTRNGFELSGMSASKGGRLWCSEIETIPLLEAVIVSLMEWCKDKNYQPETLQDIVNHFAAMRREEELEKGELFREDIARRLEVGKRCDFTPVMNFQFAHTDDYPRPTEQINALAVQIRKVWPLDEVIRCKTSDLLTGIEGKNALYIIDDDGEGPMINPRLKAISDAMLLLARSGPVILSYKVIDGLPRAGISTMNFLSTALFVPNKHGTVKCLRHKTMLTGFNADFTEQNKE